MRDIETGPMQRSGVLGKYLTADQLKAQADVMGELDRLRQAARALLEAWPMPKAREQARLALVAALRTEPGRSRE